MGRSGQIIGSVLFFLVGSIVLILFLNPELLVPPSSDLRQLETETFHLINQERSEKGLPLLTNNTQLVVIAQEWSASMLSERNLEHGDFEGRMRKIGYLDRFMCGEIIGMLDGYRSNIPSLLVQGWMESPPHRETMLTSKNGEMGVGIARESDSYYATVDFIFYDS